MFLVTSAYGSRYHSLTSQVGLIIDSIPYTIYDLMNTQEMGKVEIYIGFVNCILTILSQRLVTC